MKRRSPDFSSRSESPDEEFVRICGYAGNEEATHVALGVRRAIAKLGNVKSAVIYATDSFRNELSYLPFWDSMDMVELVMTIEEETGVSLPNAIVEKLPYPEVQPPTFTVGDFVQAVVRVATRTA